jgi:hypothetical protein
VVDVVAIARELAAEHPHTKLPCPVCGASVKAENLEKHLAKVHSNATVASGTMWRGKGALGIAPCSLVLDGDTLVLSHWLGLARRVVRLPCAIEIGGTVGERTAAGMSSYQDEMNVPTETVKTGSYVRFGEITIGCKHDTLFAEHWRGWTRGKRRGGVDITLAREALVAIEYALAKRGVLVPAITSSS